MFTYADRPETIGKVLDNGFKLYKASLKQVLLLSFLGAASGILYTFAPDYTDPEALNRGLGLFFMLVLLAMTISTFFYCAIIVHIHGIAAQNTPSIGNSMSIAAKRFFPIIIATILYVLAVGLGLVVLVIPGIFLSVALFFYSILMLADNESMIASLKKSYRLVYGNWWRSVALLSIPVFIFGAIFVLVGLIMGLYISTMPETAMMGDEWKMLELVSNVINAIISAFLSPLFYAFLLVILHDLKLRKQGLDLQARMEQA